MKKLIYKLLSEIKLTTKKDDFNWRYVQSNKPKSNDVYNKKHIFTFRTPKYKYIVESEEYDYGFYLISFKPKLNKDFFVKQSDLASKGQPHFDEYSYQTKENIPFKIMGILVDYMREVLKLNPNASFGYFGAADIKTGEDADLFNTKRVRVYNEIMVDEFGDTHYVEFEPNFSGGLVLNKETLGNHPYLSEFGTMILRKHL